MKYPTHEEETMALRLAHAIGATPLVDLPRNLKLNTGGSPRLLSMSLLFQGTNHSTRYDDGLGRVHHKSQNVDTAISMNGLCCYDDILRSLSSDARSFSMVHIIPGYISYQDRRYDFVHDPQHSQPQFVEEGVHLPLRADGFGTTHPALLDVTVDACVIELSGEGGLHLFTN